MMQPGMMSGVAPGMMSMDMSMSGMMAPTMPPMPSPTEEIATLWIGSVPTGTTEMELVQVFSQFGTVVATVVHKKPSPQGSVNGFVRYASRMEGERALQTIATGCVNIKGLP